MTEQNIITPTQAEISAALQKGLTQAQQDASASAALAAISPSR